MITKIFNDKGYLIKSGDVDTCVIFDNTSHKGIPQLISFYIVEVFADDSHGTPSSNNGEISIQVGDNDGYLNILDVDTFDKYESYTIGVSQVADVVGTRDRSHSPTSDYVRVSLLFTPEFSGNYTNTLLINYGDSHTDNISIILEPGQLDERYTTRIENEFGEDIMTKWYNAIAESDIDGYIDYDLLMRKQKEFIVMMPSIAPIINTRKGIEYFIKLFGWIGVDPYYKFLKDDEYVWDERHKIPNASKTMFFSLINNLNVEDERHESFGYWIYSNVADNSYGENIDKLIDFAKLIIKYCVGGSILEKIIFQANLSIPVGMIPSIHAIESRNIVISNNIDVSFSDDRPYITVDNVYGIDNNSGDGWENEYDTWFDEVYRGDKFSDISAKTTMTIDSFDLSWDDVNFSWDETTTNAIEPMSWVNGGYMMYTKTYIRVYNPLSGEEHVYEGDPSDYVDLDLNLKTTGKYNVIITNTRYNTGDVTTELLNAIEVRMYEPLMMSYHDMNNVITWDNVQSQWDSYDGWYDDEYDNKYDMQYSTFPVDELKSANLVSSADYDDDRIGLDEKSWDFFRTSVWDKASTCSWDEWELKKEKPKGVVISTNKIERFNTWIWIDYVKITFGADAKSPETISAKIQNSDSEFTSRFIGDSKLTVVDEDFSSDPSIMTAQYKLNDDFIENRWSMDGDWSSHGSVDWLSSYNTVMTKQNDKYSLSSSVISDQPIIVDTFRPVVFSVANSGIHGKNTAKWEIISDGVTELEIDNERFVYSFGDPGNYDVSVVVVDNNGNESKKLIRKNFITVV